MKTLIAIIVAAGLLAGCSVYKSGTQVVDPAQVANLTAMAQSVTAIGVQGVLAKNPAAKGQLLAVAEAIEQAMALPDTPKPDYLTQLITGAIGQFGGPYGALASLAINGGLSFYRSFYSANVNSQLDKVPAFKAVLGGMAKGIRDGTAGLSVAAGPGPVSDVDLVLRAAP